MVARDAIASSSGRSNHLSFLVGAIDLCSLPYLEPMSADDKMRSSAPRLLLRKCSAKRTLHYQPFEDRSASRSACADVSTRNAMLPAHLGKKLGDRPGTPGFYVFITLA